MKSIALQGTVVSVVAALSFLAVTVPAEADHTAAVLSVPGQVAVGETVEVALRVSEAETASPGRVSQGQALPGTTVTFYTTESFGGVTGKVEIGRAVTDANGVAAIRHEPRATGDHQISVEYLVGGEGQTGASAVISVAGVGTTQLYHSHSGIHIPGLNVWILMAVLATVWAILLSVALCVIVIAHAGSDSGTGSVRDMVGAR
jgi:hypothetical protein